MRRVSSKKALEVLSTIAKVLENRAQDGVLPIAAPSGTAKRFTGRISACT